MVYRAVILPAAKNDIKEAALWYNEKLDGLGKRFTQSIRNEIAVVKNNPLLYEIRYEDVHVALIKNFPYLLHFTINNNLIIIKAVFHTSRNSEVWLQRE